MSVTWKPVPKTMTSTSRSLPSPATIVLPRISLIPPVSSSTLSLASVGYQRFDGRIRLHPNV